jgi:hypothetical protein
MNQESDSIEEDKVEAQPELDLSLPVEQEIARGDVNLKRFGNFIFPHHRTKNLNRRREFISPVTLDNGRTATQRIVIEPVVDGRAYTTFTQRVYYALVLLWYERGTPDGWVRFSFRELARKLNIKESSWGGSIVTRLRRELDSLRKTNIDWFLSFESAEKQRSTERGFHILEEYEADSREQKLADGRTAFEIDCAVRFNARILSNLQTVKTAPLNFTALLSIKSSVAEMFYVRIDSILAQRPSYELTSIKALRELELEDSAEYVRNTSKRKQLLERIARDIDRKPLSTGDIVIAHVERTADGSDWKIVCRRERATEQDLQPDRTTLPVVNKDKDYVAYLADEMANGVGYREENAELYKKLARHYPDNLLFQAISEFKADRPSSLKNPGGFFIDLLHRLVHKHGREWIKDCGPDCSRRPGNSLL